VRKYENYNEKADIFALGVLMYEMFARNALLASFGTPEAVEQYCLKVAEAGHRPEFPKTFSAGLQALISKCWSQESRDRPSATAVLHELDALDACGEIGSAFRPAKACCFA